MHAYYSVQIIKNILIKCSLKPNLICIYYLQNNNISFKYSLCELK